MMTPSEARARSLAERYRTTGIKPTVEDKIATLGCAEELAGFRAQYLADHGVLPTEVFRALATRRAAIERATT